MKPREVAFQALSLSGYNVSHDADFAVIAESLGTLSRHLLDPLFTEDPRKTELVDSL